MEDNHYIKCILEKIESVDPEAFNRFAEEHPICFQKGKSDWLFPMLFNFYTDKVHNEMIVSLLKDFGLHLHNECMNYNLYEITMIDKSLCVDDSYVENYIRKIQNAQSDF